MTNPEVSFLRPSGQNYVWRLRASLFGSSVGGGSTYSWFVDDQLVPGNGASLDTGDTGISGQPGPRNIKAVVVDAQNRTSTAERMAAFNRPALNEPGERYPAVDPSQGRFLDSSGHHFEFDANKINNGLIVITHGLWSSEEEPWLDAMADAISTRLANDSRPVPNIAIFDWREGATPTIELSESEITQRIAHLLHINPDRVDADVRAVARRAYDIVAVAPYALDYGGTLANWINTEIHISPQHINPSLPIQLIGHSAGGYLVSRCADTLRYSNVVTTSQITLLDTPFLELGPISPFLSSGGSTLPPGRADFYVSSLIGYLNFAIPFQFLGASNFHRRQLYTLLPPATLAAHGYSHEWYTGTTAPGGEHDGFWFSPFMGNVW